MRDEDSSGDEILGVEEILGAEEILAGEEIVVGDGEESAGEESSGDEIGLRLFRRRKKGAPKKLDPIVAKRVAEQGVVVKTHGYSKGRSQSLGFEFLAIQPGATVDVTANPQVLFKPKRLVYTGPANTFVIQDAKIGRSSQFVASGPQAADAYPPTSTVDNMELDTAKPGVVITLRVQNVSGVAADFRATMFGLVAE